MATDIDAIIKNIISFYDVEGKSVCHVGAGGGQFIKYFANARSVFGVDPDPEAVALLKAAVQHSGLGDRYTVFHGEFSSVAIPADVVFFEFCLHEMDDPEAALSHAQRMAPDILVLDHHPDSSWAWYTCEEGKAARSWNAVRRLHVVREALFQATQHFDTYQQLLSKIHILGKQAINRIREFSDREDIRINMEYAIALISKGR